MEESHQGRARAVEEVEENQELGSIWWSKEERGNGQGGKGAAGLGKIKTRWRNGQRKKISVLSRI